MPRLLALLVALALGGCEESRPWTAYALRDVAGADDLRILGRYARAEDCRQGALLATSDPDHENLVCARDCPPARDGVLTDCAETLVVRVPDTLVPAGEPRAAAG